MADINIEVEYSTPRFRDLNVPNLSAVQSGKRLTIMPRRVTFHPRPEGLAVYVEGRSVIQSTGNPGQHIRSIRFGTPTGLTHDDTVPLANAPMWLLDLVRRVQQFEARRSSGSQEATNG